MILGEEEEIQQPAQCDCVTCGMPLLLLVTDISYLPGMDLPGKVRGDREKCTPVMCCEPFGLWLPWSNHLTASLSKLSKGFLAFYLYADACASDCMNQDSNNKELHHLECTYFFSCPCYRT